MHSQYAQSLNNMSFTLLTISRASCCYLHLPHQIFLFCFWYLFFAQPIFRQSFFFWVLPTVMLPYIFVHPFFSNIFFFILPAVCISLFCLFWASCHSESLLAMVFQVFFSQPFSWVLLFFELQWLFQKLFCWLLPCLLRSFPFYKHSWKTWGRGLFISFDTFSEILSLRQLEIEEYNASGCSNNMGGVWLSQVFLSAC